MKWTKARIKRLITGNYRWISDDGILPEHYGWRDRWAIDGIHSWSWWWVEKYGKLPCGCTRNPLTRRMVTYTMHCTAHPIFRKNTDA